MNTSSCTVSILQLESFEIFCKTAWISFMFVQSAETARLFDDHIVSQCAFNVILITVINLAHLDVEPEKYVKILWTVPKNVIIHGDVSVACKPTKFKQCDAQGPNFAHSLIWTILAWTQLFWPAMFASLSKAWPLQSSIFSPSLLILFII